jgi:heptosyltransferase-3
MTILIYRLGSLGDTILALPTLRRVRQLYPRARILLLTNRPVNAKATPMVGLLQGTGIIDATYEYPLRLRSLRSFFTLTKQLRNESIDLAIHLAASRGRVKSARDWIFLRLSGARRVVGVPWRKRDLSFVPDLRRPGLYEWEAERIARRVVRLGSVDLTNVASWDLQLTDEEFSAADALLRAGAVDGNFIALSVGTKADSNDWTQANWVALLRQLQAYHASYALLLLGAGNEFERSEECRKAWGGRALNLCGQTTPRVSAALLQRAILFLGHDSGPMHLAGAMGTPCVAIFSARNLAGCWYPRENVRNRVLYHHVPCEGCGLVECREYGKKCILSISIDEVKNATEELLKQERR